MRLSEAFKEQYNRNALARVDVSDAGLPGVETIYCRPLTVAQAREIDQVKEDWQRIAKHFQIRARDENGDQLVKPGEIDDLMRYASAEALGKAVIAMQQTDDDAEVSEKNS